jgi:hypothetical protein
VTLSHASGGPTTADDDRDRREAHAAHTLAKLLPFDKAGSEARLQAIHSELMYAIDRIVREQKQKPYEAARFNDGEIEVLRSIALQIIYVIDSAYRPKPGPFRRWCNDFKKLSPVTKTMIIGGALTTVIGGAYAVFHDYVHPIEKPAVVAPAKAVEPIRPVEAPTPPPAPPAAPPPKKP